jgi:hypothetical protein
MKSQSVTSRLKLETVTLSQAEATMNGAGAYAPLVILATFTLFGSQLSFLPVVLFATRRLSRALVCSLSHPRRVISQR